MTSPRTWSPRRVDVHNACSGGVFFEMAQIWLICVPSHEWPALISAAPDSAIRNSARHYSDHTQRPRLVRGRCAHSRRHGRLKNLMHPAGPRSGQPALSVGFRPIRPLTEPPQAERDKFWNADLTQLQEDVDHRIDNEGRGARGVSDAELPAAIKKLSEKR